MGTDEELTRKDLRLREHGLYDSDIFSMDQSAREQFIESTIGYGSSEGSVNLDDVIEVFLLKLNPQITAEVLTSPGHGSLNEIQTLYEIARSALEMRYQGMIAKAKGLFRNPYQEALDNALNYMDYMFAHESLRFIEANFEDGREKGLLASRVERIKSYCSGHMKSLNHIMGILDMDISSALRYHKSMKSPEKARKIDLLVSEFDRQYHNAEDELKAHNNDKALKSILKLRSAYFRLTSQMLHYCYARVLGGLDLPERRPEEQVSVLANNLIQTFAGPRDGSY
ncbi:hypothetical protein JW968_04335 [Candidatus Woesearchaeota archaeon]|nr:hypothetical protein [Candidatus Woesearchaeota archaeon]